MFELFKKRPTKHKETLDFLIEREWTPSQVQFNFDLEQKSAELESDGFSPEFLNGFEQFCRILRHLYGYAIYGMSPERFLREGENGEFGIVYLSQMISGAPFGREPLPTLSQDNIPNDERHKLLNRRYVLMRAAKTLINISPVGEAIDSYRKENPLPQEFPSGDCRHAGTFMNYRPTMFYLVQEMQSDINREANKPYLNGSDAKEGDFYYAARDLLKNEEALLNTFPKDESAGGFAARMNLITPGTQIPQTYAARFKTAKRKLEKYGTESIGKYFVSGEVGENGKDGQLVLFGRNLPKGTKHYS